jgi:hypothetical protein
VRFERHVPAHEIEQVKHVLRATAVTSEDPSWRRRVADASFRSLGGVWTQYYLARRSRAPEQRSHVPHRLSETWAQFDRNPEFVASLAQEVRQRVFDKANPYRVTDTAALRLFLADVAALLEESVELVGTFPASRVSPDLVSAHAAAWRDLRQRELLPSVFAELDQPEAAAALEEVGLTGVHLGFKLTGWLGALTEWRDARTAESLRRAFHWANVVLGSLGQVLAGPAADIFKEFKEGTEAVLDEAVPPGGYLPAPAFG